tara:strand:- start:1217 stop:1411 length:195 start_codon:yes stop_codon:yes gene_type:complete
MNIAEQHQQRTDMIKEIVSKIPFNRRHWTEEEMAEKRQWFEDEISLVYQLGKLHQWRKNNGPTT